MYDQEIIEKKPASPVCTSLLGAAALALSLVTAACDEAVTAPDLGSSDAVAFQNGLSAKGGNGGGPTKATTNSTTTTTTTI